MLRPGLPLTPLLFCGPLLAAAANSSSAAPSSRRVLWYLGDYSAAYVDENKQFLGQHGDVVSGILHCCGGPSVLANGSVAVPAATRKLYTDLTKPELELKLAPVMLPLSPDPWAVQSGQALKAAPALAELVVELGVSGLVADYEPHANTTAAHARAFAAFLTSLATALHAKQKELAVCVSDWGILAPQYYPLLAASKADLFVSMGSTYKNQGPITKLNVLAMTKAFPLKSIAIGIGTMAPPACAAVQGLLTGDYKWTEPTLTAFLGWVEAQGITTLGVWRADIASLLYKQPHYCGVDEWMYGVFAKFLHGAAVQGAPVHGASVHGATVHGAPV